MGVKFDIDPLLRAKFHPHWCNDKGIGPPELKFIVRFDQNVEYKRSAIRRGVSLARFSQNLQCCTPFQDALAVNISWICSRGYGVMGF